MMKEWNPFKQSTIPYHHVDSAEHKSSLDDGSDHAESSSSAHEGDYLTGKAICGPRPRPPRFGHSCCYTLVALIGLLIGMIAGQFFSIQHDIDGYLPPYGDTVRNVRNVEWQLNTTFAAVPNPETDAAWESIIPLGRGFVAHPKLTSNEMKSVSVFHQIHCLHGIRTAFFHAHHQASKFQHQHNPDHPYVPNPYLENVNAHGLHPEHVKHCFDYLRQALMCAADTNLEDTDAVPGDDGIPGAPGWGTKRVCRDFAAVSRWSEKWRTGDGDGIVS